MVYYFTSTVVDPSAFIYVGKDKFESTGHAMASFLHWQTCRLTPVQMRT